MAESKPDALIDKVYHSVLDFCRQARKVTEDVEMAKVEMHTRMKVAASLYEAIDQSKRLLEVLRILCPRCRKAGGERLGVCIQCKEAACTLCALEVDGKVVHRDICARFLKGEEGG